MAIQMPSEMTMTICMPDERYGYPEARWKETLWLSGCQVKGNGMAICVPRERKPKGYPDARGKEMVWVSGSQVTENCIAIWIPACTWLGWEHWATYCSKANKTAAKVEKQGDRQTDRRLKIILCRLIV